MSMLLCGDGSPASTPLFIGNPCCFERPRLAAILGRYANRLLSLFGKARVINDPRLDRPGPCHLRHHHLAHLRLTGRRASSEAARARARPERKRGVPLTCRLERRLSLSPRDTEIAPPNSIQRRAWRACPHAKSVIQNSWAAVSKSA